MAKQTWTVKGRIMFEPQFEETRDVYGTRVALPNVRVQVSAKETKLDPTWGEWHDAQVGKQGRFSFTIEKDKTPRYFRVRMQFKDDTLKLYPPPDGFLSKLTEAVTGITPVTDLAEDALEVALSQTTRLAYDVRWFLLVKDHDKDERRGPGTVDFGDLVFRANPGKSAHDLGDRTARRHADIWWLAKTIIATLDELGHGFVEKRPPAFIHPFQSPLVGDGVEASYANPQNDVVHLIENSRSDHFNAATVGHELLHLWAYQHSTGEKGLAWQLLIHGSTHDGRQKKTWVAFHEAFAEWASNLLYTEIYDGRQATIYGDVDKGTDPDTELDNRAVPFSRRFLRSVGVTSLGELDHYEYGWIALLTALVSDGLDLLDPDTEETWADYPGSRTWTAGSLRTVGDLPGLEDILRAFDAAPKKGFDGLISKKELNRVDFLDRILAISPAVSKERVDLINELLDTTRSRPVVLPEKPPQKPKQTQKARAVRRREVGTPEIVGEGEVDRDPATPRKARSRRGSEERRPEPVAEADQGTPRRARRDRTHGRPRPGRPAGRRKPEPSGTGSTE